MPTPKAQTARPFSCNVLSVRICCLVDRFRAMCFSPCSWRLLCLQVNFSVAVRELGQRPECNISQQDCPVYLMVQPRMLQKNDKATRQSKPVKRGAKNMGQQRYSATLKKWNAERGFGSITADDDGQDIFVHISAFSRDGGQPQVGEAFGFEVEHDHNGKRRAVQVLRLGEPVGKRAPQRPVRLSKSANDNALGFFGKLFGALRVCAPAFYCYRQYSKRAAKYDSILPVPPASIAPGKLPVPVDFKCDGRNLCSQMTSCREATLFLQNCPGMQLDGNGDGVSCEKQWCTN